MNMRLMGRFISREQILAAVDTSQSVESYPDDKYLPSCHSQGSPGPPVRALSAAEPCASSDRLRGTLSAGVRRTTRTKALRYHPGWRVLMIRTVEAVVDPNGNIRLLEDIHLSGPRRALVTILDDAPRSEETALLSERALADWSRPEEDAAWSHLQPAR